MRHDNRTIDVAIVGAGLLGCSVAAQLAEEGVAVTVFDSQGVGGGASGRNSGAVEHPYDVVQRDIYDTSLRLMREIGLLIPDAPVGVLLLDPDEHVITGVAADMRAAHPELQARIVDPDELVALEPALAGGQWACRLATGFPVPPRLATELYAERAADRGATFRMDTPARLVWEGARCVGLHVGGENVRASHVVVAAGHATSMLVDPDGGWAPVIASWGVNVEISLPAAPRHLLRGAGVVRAQTGQPSQLEHAFSLSTTGTRTALGSTFLGSEPEPQAWVNRLLESGSRFVPAVRDASVRKRLTCARPRSLDGRPLLGHVAGAENLLVATGNGGRGISTGAASGRLVAEAVLAGSDELIPPALRAGRFPLRAASSPRTQVV